MRVIAGTARGVSLTSPRGTGTRPITDRVKETLFAILGERVPDARVLDLYAGSGAIGIEALSRGARSVDFVERDRSALAAIDANLERTRLAPSASVHGIDVNAFCAPPAAPGTSPCSIRRTRRMLSWRRFAPSCRGWLRGHRS